MKFFYIVGRGIVLCAFCFLSIVGLFALAQNNPKITKYREVDAAQNQVNEVVEIHGADKEAGNTVNLKYVTIGSTFTLPNSNIQAVLCANKINSSRDGRDITIAYVPLKEVYFIYISVHTLKYPIDKSSYFMVDDRLFNSRISDDGDVCITSEPSVQKTHK